jgi:hypothetical protein
LKHSKGYPPSIAYANSAGAAYIPMPEGRGFTPHFGNNLFIIHTGTPPYLYSKKYSKEKQGIQPL